MEIFNNFLTGTLAANITSSATTMTMIYSGSLGQTIPTFTNLKHSFRVRIGTELLQVTGSSLTSGVYTFTIVRAVEFTTAVGHALGDQVHFVLTAGALFNRWADNDLNIAANRSDPYMEGRFFFPTNQPVAWRDNGSSWDPLGPIWSSSKTPPHTLTWTPVNLTNANATFAVNTATGRSIFSSTGASSTQMAIEYITAPATPYTLDCMILPNWNPANVSGSLQIGICFYNTSNTKYQTIAYDGSLGYLRLIGSRYTNHTTWASDDLAAIKMSYEQCRWLRLTNDGTTLKAWISADRMAWMLAWSVAVGTHMTPNALGIFMNPARASSPVGVTFVHWMVF